MVYQEKRKINHMLRDLSLKSKANKIIQHNLQKMKSQDISIHFFK